MRAKVRWIVCWTLLTASVLCAIEWARTDVNLWAWASAILFLVWGDFMAETSHPRTPWDA